jgi:release factor glutamine methyltransferase
LFKDINSIFNIFNKNGVENPLMETMRLLDILSEGKIRDIVSIAGKETIDVEDIVLQRQKGVPLEYILGQANFMGRSFHCTGNTLIPTEETSLLVMTAYDLINRRLQAGLGAQTVIEIGTGCGNIAVSLAKLCDENVTILASDISPEAVEIAYKNVRKFNVQGKISLFCGDLFRPFTDYEGKTDMVICNPPYIPTSFLKKLSPEIIDHEPVLALDGGPYGIDIFRKLMNGALTVLKRGGVLVFEIGAGQEKLIERLFEKNTSYNEILHFKYDEHVRVISAIRK